MWVHVLCVVCCVLGPALHIQVVRDHVRNVGLTVVKDLQSKGGMDVSDDDGMRDDLPSGGKPAVTSADVVAEMLQVYDEVFRYLWITVSTERCS